MATDTSLATMLSGGFQVNLGPGTARLRHDRDNDSGRLGREEVEEPVARRKLACCGAAESIRNGEAFSAASRFRRPIGTLQLPLQVNQGRGRPPFLGHDAKGGAPLALAGCPVQSVGVASVP